MKRILISIATILVLTAGPAVVFADGKPKVSQRVIQTLEKQYPGASPIEWSAVHDFLLGRFVFQNHSMEAYFDPEEGWVGTASQISFFQLPMTIERAVMKKFVGGDVVETLEFTNSTETTYWLSIVQKGRHLFVEIDADSAIIVKKVINS